MKKLILIIALIAGFSASAQHFAGTKTISTFSFNNNHTILIMGQTDRPISSYTLTPGFNSPVQILGTQIEPGKMYWVRLEGNLIRSVEKFGKKEENE